MNQSFIVKIAHGLTASGQGSVFGQRNDFLGFRSHGFGAGGGGGNPTVTEQFGSQRPQEGFALVGRFAEEGDINGSIDEFDN